MTTNIKSIVVLVNLVLVLVFFNWSVAEKEEILSDGKLMLLKLAPVDPRSLMQGDYMRLSYAISQPQDPDSLKNLESRGYAVVQVDAQQVAHLVRYQPDQKPLQKGEYLLQYRKGDWSLNLGAEAFFFEEGLAKQFEQAAYGGLKVDANGNSVLVGLYDEQRNLIVPERDNQQ